jgi:hypothetical protein
LFASYGLLAACSLTIIAQAKAGRGELHLSAVVAEDKRVERILGTENLDPVDGRMPDRADPVVYDDMTRAPPSSLTGPTNW